MSESEIGRGNLFADIPGDLPHEFVEVLAGGCGDLKIERIVSRGHSSPAGSWYDQETVEWVVLLQGGAVLEFKNGGDGPVELKPGDWMNIPAGCLHRVVKTEPEEDTVWLAIHWK